MDGWHGRVALCNTILKSTHRKECSVAPPSLSDARAGRDHAKCLVIASSMYEQMSSNISSERVSYASFHTPERCKLVSRSKDSEPSGLGYLIST